MANCSCKKFFPTTYPLATVHPLQTDRQTDDGRTNDNSYHRADLSLQLNGRFKSGMYFLDTV